LQVIEDVPDGSKAEALQLALNCSQLAPDTVTALLAAVDQLAAQLEPAAAHRLLATALKRQHADTALHMLKCTSIGQHIADDERVQAFDALVFDQLQLLGREQQQHIMMVVGSDIPQVLAFLSMSVRRNKPASTSMLCTLPAAQRLSSTVVTGLLNEAVEHKATECAAALCTLPQSRSISTTVLEPLLESAVAGHNMQLAQELAVLPAAARISSETLAQLLQAAVKEGVDRSSVSVIGRLCRLPAAYKLSSDQIEQLLRTAAEQGKGKELCTALMFDLPGAQQLSSAAATRLLQAAVQRSCRAADRAMHTALVPASGSTPVQQR
jgi:hypothetical protein